MEKEFQKVVAAVCFIMGVKQLPVNASGQLDFSEAQKKELKEKYGESFLSKFTEKFNASAAPSTEDQDCIAAYTQALADIKQERDAAIAERDIAKGQLEMIKESAVPDETEEKTSTSGPNKKSGFKPNMSLQHNRSIADVLSNKIVASSATIEVDELKTEFGQYVSSDKLDIFKALTKSLDCVQFMRTVITDKDIWRASKIQIGNLMQRFYPKWTPTNGIKVTPIAINNRDIKINVGIVPADILESVISYLYDHNLKVEDMPITKFIINEMLMPKLDEERTMTLCQGEYTETEDGKPGSPMGCMDGVITILKSLRKSGTGIGSWFQDQLGTLNVGKYLEYFEKLDETLPSALSSKKLFVFADPQICKQYSREYREKYPNTKNEDGTKLEIDDSNLKLQPLEGLKGTGVFFITPKENFVHLLSTDPSRMSVFLKGDVYDVKVYAHWREAVGFAIAEYIYAYLPEDPEQAEPDPAGDNTGDGI